MRVVDFPLLSKKAEVSWEVCPRVKDAVVLIKQGDNLVEFTPIQGLEFLKIFAGKLLDAHLYNIQHGCVGLGPVDNL
jgi:hypothetical protein